MLLIVSSLCRMNVGCWKHPELTLPWRRELLLFFFSFPFSDNLHISRVFLWCWTHLSGIIKLINLLASEFSHIYSTFCTVKLKHHSRVMNRLWRTPIKLMLVLTRVHKQTLAVLEQLLVELFDSIVWDRVCSLVDQSAGCPLTSAYAQFLPHFSHPSTAPSASFSLLTPQKLNLDSHHGNALRNASRHALKQREMGTVQSAASPTGGGENCKWSAAEMCIMDVGFMKRI